MNNIKVKILLFLKRVPFVFYLNAKWKSRKVKYFYKKIIQKYENLEQSYSFEELLLQKGFNNKWKDKFIKRRSKVFYLGTDEFQDKSGFLQTLNKFSDVTYFTKEDGSYGQYKRSENVVENNSKRIVELFKQLEEQKKIPDLLIMQTWAWRIDVDVLSQLKKTYDLKIINISMDDRHTYYDNGIPKLGVKGLIPVLDLALTASLESVDWYLKENIPALYFPEASSLEFFHPLNLEKKYDVGFVGGKYGVREKIVNSLIKGGVEVVCFGSGWENGRLPLSDTNKFFNQCKIILGIGTIGYSEDFYALKLRDFDAPLSGSCYVTHHNKDLESLYDEDAIVLCENVDSFVNKIKWLLEDEEKIFYFAKKGFSNAKLKHTYDKRIQFLYQELGIKVQK